MVSEQDGKGSAATLKRSRNLARSSANLELVPLGNGGKWERNAVGLISRD